MRTREQVEAEAAAQKEFTWSKHEEKKAKDAVLDGERAQARVERQRIRDERAAAKGSKPPVYGVDVAAPPCPLCGSKACQVVGASVRYVYCQRCRMTGPSCGSDAEAIEFWAGLRFGGRDWNQEEEECE